MPDKVEMTDYELEEIKREAVEEYREEQRKKEREEAITNTINKVNGMEEQMMSMKANNCETQQMAGAAIVGTALAVGALVFTSCIRGAVEQNNRSLGKAIADAIK